MRMKLSDWLEQYGGKLTLQQTADVIAQLLEYICKGGKMYADCLCIEWSESETNGFGSLFRENGKEAYDNSIRPIAEDGGMSDDVFAAGIALYRMLTGQTPDYQRAQLLLIGAGKGKRVPFVKYEGSSLSDLLERMTEVSAESRISADEALDLLAGQFGSEADICITESHTDAELKTYTVTLDKGFLNWKPNAEYVFDQQHFFPQKKDGIEISYRVKKLTYRCDVSTERYVPKAELDIKAEEGCKSFGIDLGACNLLISCLDSEGNIFELDLGGKPTVSAAAAYRTGGDSVFGSEAEELNRKTGAELIYCFSSDYDTDDDITVTAADGTTVQICISDVIRDFFTYLKELMIEKADYSPEHDSTVIALRACSSQRYRIAVTAISERVGIKASTVSGIAAVGLSFLASEESDKKLMIVDAGSNDTCIGIVPGIEQLSADAASEFTTKWLGGVRASGGTAVTDALCTSMKHELNHNYGLNMFSRERSGLNPRQFEENERTIRKAAETIKKKLSFSDNADCELELCSAPMQIVKAKLGYTRDQLNIIAASMLHGINEAMQRCLSEDNSTKYEIDWLLITGGSSLIPAVRDKAARFFKETPAKIRMLYDITAVSRGAAICASIRTDRDVSVEHAEIDDDLGIMTVDAVSGIPVFQCKLAVGTQFKNGKASFSYTFKVHDDDFDDQGFCTLKLYTRKKGMEYVRSTIDPNGSAIRYIGKIKTKLPETFEKSTDFLIFTVEIDPLENLKVRIKHVRPKSGLEKLVGYFRNNADSSQKEWHVVDENLPAKFIPYVSKG